MAITHKYTLVCDDIRREDNGKMMVIGMYNSTILVPQIPFVLPSLAFLMVLDSDRPGNWALKFRLQHLESGRALVDGHGMTNIVQPGTGFAPIKFSPVQFQALGVYTLSVNIEEHREPIITEFSVLLPSQVQSQQLPPSFRG